MKTDNKKQETVSQQLESVQDEKVEKTEEQKHAEKVERARTVLAPYHFQKGKSGNPNGRPKDVLKEIGKDISKRRIGGNLSERERKQARQLGFNPDEITMIEQIMLSLATSKNPLKIALFLERTYGKVPNININAEVNTQLVMRFRSKLTDAELEDIANGANPMDILFDKLPDVDDAPRLDDYNVIDADAEYYAGHTPIDDEKDGTR